MFPESFISFPAWSGEAAQVFVVSLARTRTEAERRQASHALRSGGINFQLNQKPQRHSKLRLYRLPPQSQATAADFCFQGSLSMHGNGLVRGEGAAVVLISDNDKVVCSRRHRQFLVDGEGTRCTAVGAEENRNVVHIDAY